MAERIKKKLTDPSEVPPGMNEEQEAAFWRIHELTNEFFKKLEPTPRDRLPASRSKQVSMRLPVRNIQRAKALAESRGTKYQTLLNEFINKQLDQEEGKEEREAALNQQLLERVDQLEAQLLERVDQLEAQLLERVDQLSQPAVSSAALAAATNRAWAARENIDQPEDPVTSRSSLNPLPHSTLMEISLKHGLPLPSEDFPGESSVAESNKTTEEIPARRAAQRLANLVGYGKK